MNLEYFIARRVSSGGDGAHRSLMMRVATLAVTLSIAVMIITLAVISGFKSDITTSLTSLTGHVVVTSARGVDPSATFSMERNIEVEDLINRREVVQVSPYALSGGVLRVKDRAEGVVLKGVDSMFKGAAYSERLKSGEFGNYSEKRASREILLSSELASKLGVAVGERVEFLFADKSGEMDRYLFKVGGVYLSTMGQSESQIAICDIRAVRRIVEWEDGLISGYEIWLNDERRAEIFRDDIERRFMQEQRENFWGIGFFSYKQVYPAIFDWLTTHDVNAVVVIVIMLLVAIFNMTTALLILVLERTNMIGVLKTLGMSNSSIGRIFIYQALNVIVRGVFWGNVIAILLCLIQKQWGIIGLNEEGYMLSQVPIKLELWWILGINIAAIAVIGIVMIIPSRFVSRIEPCESVKFN